MLSAQRLDIPPSALADRFSFAGVADTYTVQIVTATFPAIEVVNLPDLFTLHQGVGDRSLRLDGTNSYAEVPHSTDLNITGDWTVEAWFKDEDPNGFNHDYRQILMKGDRNANPEAPYFVLLGQNNIIGGVRTGGVDYALSFNMTALGIDPQAWHHVAVTFDAAKNWLDLYIDGKHAYALVVPTHSQTGNSLQLEIGRNGPVTGKYWDGKIDDLRIWNIDRGAADIAADFQHELTGTPPSGPVANWKFDEGSGTTAFDSSGNHHDASLHGGANFSADVHP